MKVNQKTTLTTKLRFFSKTVCATLALLIFTSACKSQGQLEKAGEKVDNAIEDAGEAVEDAGDRVERETSK